MTLTHIEKLKRLAEKWGWIDVEMVTPGMWVIWSSSELNKPGYRGKTPEQAIDKAYEAEGMR